jgi:hypothetical protein
MEHLQGHEWYEDLQNTLIVELVAPKPIVLGCEMTESKASRLQPNGFSSPYQCL